MIRASAVAAVATLGIGAAAFSFAHAQVPQASPGQPAAAVAAAAPQQPTHAASTAVDTRKGRELFDTWGCSSCHVLAGAGASGQIGPCLDKNPNLTHAIIVDRVTKGARAMPAFGGQMTDEEIAAVAAYISQVAAK